MCTCVRVCVCEIHCKIFLKSPSSRYSTFIASAVCTNPLFISFKMSLLFHLSRNLLSQGYSLQLSSSVFEQEPPKSPPTFKVGGMHGQLSTELFHLVFATLVWGEKREWRGYESISKKPANEPPAVFVWQNGGSPHTRLSSKRDCFFCLAIVFMALGAATDCASES